MTRRSIIVVLTLGGLIAFCTDSFSKSLDLIQNEQVRNYSQNEFEWGAPALPITSKILHREALDDLAGGRRESAIEKLRLAASLSGESAAPLFTLARVELMSADPGCVAHFAEGLRRSFTGFPGAAVAVLNWSALAALAFAGAFFALLVSLLVRHWAFMDHAIAESRLLRRRMLPARWILPLAAIALVFLRLGLAVYTAALIVALWTYLAKRERILVASFAAILSAASLAAPLSNLLAPAVDPGSATRRLSLVNERSVSAGRLSEIRSTDEKRYGAERDYAVGTMLYRLGLYNEARTYLLRAVSANGEFAPAFINLGNVYFVQGDYDKALAGYRGAVELDSTNAIAHYNMGQAYIKNMHFAESGVALQRASTLDIEHYRATHPGLEMRRAVVYEQGFPTKSLWRIAAAEGRSRERVILSEMLQPIFLLPFHRLWLLLAASLAAAVIAARRFSKERRTTKCENCGLPSCPQCQETIHDVKLCRECSGALKGISSAKVMEVLLRSRRQKVADARGRAHRVRTLLLPGMAHIYHGYTLTGFLLAFAGAAAAGALFWRGMYFKDPLTMNIGAPAWVTFLPGAVLAAVYSLALFAKSPQETRNYHIFSPEARALEREPAAAKKPHSSDPWTSFGSKAPPARKPIRETAPPPPEATIPKRRPPAPDPTWGNEPPPAPPRRPAAPQAPKEPAAAPPKAPPRRTAQTVDTDDFLAEIKKGSSWH